VKKCEEMNPEERMPIKEGDIVTGIVTGITKFGAFVKIDDMTGMIHISEVSREFVNDINEHLKINQEIKAVVIGMNNDGNGRLALSIKRLSAVSAVNNKNDNKFNKNKTEYAKNNPAKPTDFEDMMNKFKRDSDERIAGLKLEAKKTPRSNKNKK
jgi:S1 RNA binding domain protein